MRVVYMPSKGSLTWKYIWNCWVFIPHSQLCLASCFSFYFRRNHISNTLKNRTLTLFIWPLLMGIICDAKCVLGNLFVVKYTTLALYPNLYKNNIKGMLTRFWLLYVTMGQEPVEDISTKHNVQLQLMTTFSHVIGKGWGHFPSLNEIYHVPSEVSNTWRWIWSLTSGSRKSWLTARYHDIGTMPHYKRSYEDVMFL